MVLDELKRTSDDSHFTEEHVAFLAERHRAALLEQKYSKTNEPVDNDNMQVVCLALELFSPYGDGGCGPRYLRSVSRLPDTICGCRVRVWPTDWLSSEMFSFTCPERMRYVGRGRWTADMVYACQHPDGHLWLASSNPQMAYLKELRVSAVFADPRVAMGLSCSEDEQACDWLEADFPLEGGLVAPLVQSVLKELTAVNYTPKDGTNNAHDDLNDVQAAMAQAARQRAAARYGGN